MADVRTAEQLSRKEASSATKTVRINLKGANNEHRNDTPEVEEIPVPPQAAVQPELPQGEQQTGVEGVVGQVQAVKYDSGKAPLSLIPASALTYEAHVMGFGASKYGRDNWRKGMEWSRLLDAALRHITAFSEGEDIDPESGISHLGHARCCLAFLVEYADKGLGTDDRPKVPKV